MKLKDQNNGNSGNDSVIVMTIEASDKVLDTYEIFEAGVVEILDSFEKENHSSV